MNNHKKRTPDKSTLRTLTPRQAAGVAGGEVPTTEYYYYSGQRFGINLTDARNSTP